MPVIALGHSKFTNGMIFHNLELSSFCVLADYLIDKLRHIGEAFPSIQYNGGLMTLVLSNKMDGRPKFDIDEAVFI